jgi:cytochrome P450
MAARMLINFPGEEQLVKDIAGVTYVGGSGTTVSAVTSYFLAMVTYPHVQQLLQEELDRVVGRERLPEFSDMENLPYLEAVMRECFRWLPILPQGMAATYSSSSSMKVLIND